MTTNLIDDGLNFPNPFTRRSSTNYIIIHHTASSPDITVQDIHQMHLNQGWNGIGYHMVCLPNGEVHQGRPIWATGAQCEGHNWESIGVNLTGNFEEGDNEPTDEQMAALKTLLDDLKFAYPGAKIVGHCDLNATACPGKNLYARLGEVI